MSSVTARWASGNPAPALYFSASLSGNDEGLSVVVVKSWEGALGPAVRHDATGSATSSLTDATSNSTLLMGYREK